jgi:calmodulin
MLFVCFQGDRKLSFEEFVILYIDNCPKHDQEAELREAFRIFDRDNSGFISISELKQVRCDCSIVCQ